MKTIQFFTVFFMMLLSYTSIAQNTFPLNGNVGIGTSNPTSSLHIDGGSLLVENGFTKLTVDTDITSTNDLTIQSYGDYFILKSLHAMELDASEISINPEDAFSVTTDHAIFRGDKASFAGKVGIGTTTPDQTLTINGSMSVGNLQGTNTRFIVDSYGNVGVGTTNMQAKLTVAGDMHAREIRVKVDAGADFVFDNDYNLPKLRDVEKFLKKHKHLPEIASETEMLKNDVNVGTFQIQLLQKIEELTLYIIDLKKGNEALSERIKMLEDEK